MSAVSMFILGAAVLGGIFALAACEIGKLILKPEYSWVSWFFVIDGVFIGAKASGFIVKHFMGIA